MSIYSKTEISNAVRDMERKFEVLSKQALIKPKLEIFYDGQPISGNTEGTLVIHRAKKDK